MLFQESSIPVAICGHSFVRRLNSFIEGDRRSKINFNFSVNGVRSKFFAQGGLVIHQFSKRFEASVCWFRPQIVVLDMGGNDLDSPNTTGAQVFGQIERLVIFKCN